MSIDLKPLSCFVSYLDSLLIAIKLLLYSTNDKGKKKKKDKQQHYRWKR